MFETQKTKAFTSENCIQLLTALRADEERIPEILSTSPPLAWFAGLLRDKYISHQDSLECIAIVLHTFQDLALTICFLVLSVEIDSN